MKTIRIGNDINVVWKIFSRNGMKFSLEGKILRLWLMSGPFKKEITDYEVALRNEIHFFIDADDLHRLGVYKILLSVLDDQAETEDASFDVTEVFQLVSRSYFSTENQILDGKDIFLIVQSILTDAYTSPLEGASAYEIAVKHGYVGTEEEWVASLKGDTGETGATGKSAYQSAVDNGFEGTEAEWVYLMTKASRDMEVVEEELEDVAFHRDAGSLEDLEDPSAYATRDELDELRIKIDGMSTGKYYGFHVSEEELPEATDPGYAYVGESAPYALWNFDGLEWKDSGVTVDNAPMGNGEDISVDEDGMLKFANRAYNPEEPDGMGYVILRKDKSFAEQLTMTHTIYEIRYPFDLDGDEVTIPAGCTLKFNGGLLMNGSIVYNDTEIQGEPFISCTCTGGLRNSVVTPQMYGAKGDGVTDDFNALQNAISYNDTMFVPAGTYIISDKILLTKNKTVYGVGRESKIHNNVVFGFEKFCFEAGTIEVGTHEQSFLTITTQACSIGSDRWSVLLSDTSDYAIGDIVYICLDAAYTTKNPAYSWNAKVTAVEADTSITLDAYMDNDALVGQSCLIRNMKHLPTGSISENICIHDLSLANVVDEGSGMYVIGFAIYNASFYNLWMHGNTFLGSNYAVNVVMDNIVGEFDGGFCDIPEISQFSVLRNCHARRFGKRLNVIGLTFLQGYKVTIENNFMDFGDAGKIGVGNQIAPYIHDNVFLNINATDTSPVELSQFGNSVFQNNRISSKKDSSIVNIGGDSVTGVVFTGNIIDNPNGFRWLYPYNTIDYQSNTIKDNITSLNLLSDATYMDQVNTKPNSPIHQIQGDSTITIAPSAKRDLFDASAKRLGRPRFARATIVTSPGDYTIDIHNASDVSRSATMTDCVKVEFYIFAKGAYVRVVKYGATGAISSATLNFPNYSVGQITKMVLTNTGSDDLSLYVACIESIN